MKRFLTLIVSVALATSLQAQLLINTDTQSTTIDFQSAIGYDGPGDAPGDNVFRVDGAINEFRALAENANARWTASWNNTESMSADAWSWRAGTLNTGNGAGNASLFGDLNGDGDFGDELNNVNGLSYTQLSDIGLGSAGDWAIDTGNSNSAAPFRDYELTLRVLNNSGTAIEGWAFSLDTWYADPDGNALGTIFWSTDNVNFTQLDTYNTTATSSPTDFVEADLMGNFSATIADQEYLYLRFHNDQVGGSGSGARIVIDNWTVEAQSGNPVPEPSTYAAIFGLAALAFVIYRRRR